MKCTRIDTLHFRLPPCSLSIPEKSKNIGFLKNPIGGKYKGNAPKQLHALGCIYPISFLISFYIYNDTKRGWFRGYRWLKSTKTLYKRSRRG